LLFWQLFIDYKYCFVRHREEINFPPNTIDYRLIT
jgi:hypothetical protein